MLIKNLSKMNNFDLKTSKIGLHLNLKSKNYILLYDLYNSIKFTEISNVSWMKKIEVETFISPKQSTTKDEHGFALIKFNHIKFSI